MRSPGLQRVPTTPWLDSERQGPVVPWAIQSASVRHALVSSPLHCWQARQAHIRLSYVRAWKFPLRLGGMWRACVQLPRMHALPVPVGPASNAVAIPPGAPTCPPWVALSAVSAQLSGAQAPGMFGSQPEAPGPHASTMPPPVTRQPSVTTGHCAVAGPAVTCIPDSSVQSTVTLSQLVAVRPLTVAVSVLVSPESSVSMVANETDSPVPMQ